MKCFNLTENQYLSLLQMLSFITCNDDDDDDKKEQLG